MNDDAHNAWRNLAVYFSNRSVPASSALAARIPSEILYAIFTIVLEDGSNVEYFESQCFDAYDCSRTLLSSMQVCKRWYQVALPMLYIHVRISSFRSLRLFVRSLKDRPLGCTTRISSIKFFAPSKHFPKRVAKAYVKGCHELAELRSTIPALASTVYDFTLMHPYAHAFVTPLGSDYLKHSVNHLSGLHLTASSVGGAYYLRLHDVHFPNLRVLTLESFTITSDAAWPETPNLEFLRLKNLSIFFGAEGCTWLETPKRLKRLEIIDVDNHSEFITKLFKCGCNETLEDLVLYMYNGVNGPVTDFRRINSLKRLKRLCLGPMVFSQFDDPSTYIPTWIERLTIWEADELGDGRFLSDYLPNIPGLVRFVSHQRYVNFPLLRTIRVRAVGESWDECIDVWVEEKCRKVSLEEMFGDAGIRLEINRVPVRRPSASQRVLRKTVAGVKSTCSKISCGLYY